MNACNSPFKLESRLSAIHLRNVICAGKLTIAWPLSSPLFFYIHVVVVVLSYQIHRFKKKIHHTLVGGIQLLPTDCVHDVRQWLLDIPDCSHYTCYYIEFNGER